MLKGLNLTKKKNFHKVTTKLNFPNQPSVPVNFVALPNFHISLSSPGIEQVSNLIKSNGSLSSCFPDYKNDSINLDGIIGLDTLSSLKQFSIRNGKKSLELVLPDGIIPFGCLNKFFLEFGSSKFTSKNKNSPKFNSKAVNKQKNTFLSSKNCIPDHNDVLTLKNKFECLSNLSEELSDRQSSLPETAVVTSVHKVVNCSSKKTKNRRKNKLKSNCRQEPSNTNKSVLSKYVNIVLNPSLQPIKFDPVSLSNTESNVDTNLDRLFSLEAIGIPNSSTVSERDKQILQTFEDSIEIINGNYHVSLPWNQKILSQVPDNFELSKLIASKVDNKNKLMHIQSEYLDVFEEHKRLGIIEELNISDINTSEHIWIPHRPVIREDPLVKTTKIRPVFNCSLKTSAKPSLNEAAYPGIDLLNPLLDLLIHFRSNSTVLLADLKKAFLNIFLKDESDRNRFSFVVCNNGKYSFYRYKTILFGFVASPFVLNYILKFHAKSCSNNLISKIIDSHFYVDNLVFTSDNVEEILPIVETLKTSLNSVGFDTQEWVTNNPEISNEIESCNEPTKVLGYLYNPITDQMSIKNVTLDNTASTKRSILACQAKIFDPLGLLSPLMLPVKTFVRKLSQLGLHWDEELSPSLLSEWAKVCADFNGNDTPLNYSFPRQAFKSGALDLVVFTDASTTAFGVVIYAVQNGKSFLLFSKSKLAPIPAKTLPTLELLAIFLGFNCIKTITSSKVLGASINKIIFLSDSQIALSWVINSKTINKNIFANNRLQEIKQIKSELEKTGVNVSVQYIPTAENMADLVTRPMTAKKFQPIWEESWHIGPYWINLPPSKFPSGNLSGLPSSISILPKNSADDSFTSFTIVTQQQDPLIDPRKFSSYDRFFKTVLFTFKAVYLLTRRPCSLNILRAKTFAYIFKIMQKDCFPEELKLLEEDSPLKSSNKLITKYNLFLDNFGLIRVQLRLQNSPIISDAAKKPLLMGKHYITNLFIKKIHYSLCHMGVESTLQNLREQGYLLLKGRTLVRKCILACLICNKYNCRSGKSPYAPDLPLNRVRMQRPFSYVGIDFTGHFFIRENNVKTKVYILIFACCGSRAIHLELLRSMTTQDFILAFVRFINRYGVPEQVYSDNAKTFIAGSTLLEKIFLSSHFKSNFSHLNISFKTIPSYSSWYGALYERLIGVVKSCLYKTISKQIISFDCFITLLSDIQRSVNSRPLHYRSSHDDSFDVVTPNHFFLSAPNNLYSSILLEETNLEDLDPSESISDMLATLSFRESLLVKFNSVYFQKYLLSLKTNFREHSNDKRFKIGKVVLLKLPGRPRPYWSLAKITALHPGQDGEIRVVSCTKGDGSSSTTAIENVYPLEVDIHIDETEEANTNLPPPLPLSGQESETRPKRLAALKQRDQLTSLINDDLV